MRLPLWLADPSLPLATRLMAFRLLRVRIRRAWMAVDPFMLLTALATLVTLRIAYRAAGLEVSVENLLSGTAVALMLFAFLLGAFTKRGDNRERRVAERWLRMRGVALTPAGRLVARARAPRAARR